MIIEITKEEKEITTYTSLPVGSLFTVPNLEKGHQYHNSILQKVEDHSGVNYYCVNLATGRLEDYDDYLDIDTTEVVDVTDCFKLVGEL